MEINTILKICFTLKSLLSETSKNIWRVFIFILIVKFKFYQID